MIHEIKLVGPKDRSAKTLSNILTDMNQQAVEGITVINALGADVGILTQVLVNTETGEWSAVADLEQALGEGAECDICRSRTGKWYVREHTR